MAFIRMEDKARPCAAYAPDGCGRIVGATGARCEQCDALLCEEHQEACDQGKGCCDDGTYCPQCMEQHECEEDEEESDD